MIIRIMALCIVSICCGCAPMISKHNVNNIAEERLATVIGTENDMKVVFGYSEKIFSRIAWVYDKSGKKVIERGWENTWGLTEAKLEPGFYIFVVYCGQGNLYATPQISANLEGSKKYIASCEKSGSSESFGSQMRAYIHEVTDK